MNMRTCHQPNSTLHADANMGHRFAILMAHVGALRPYGLRRRLTRALGSRENNLWNFGLRVFAALMSIGRMLAQTQTVIGLLVCVKGSIVLPVHRQPALH